MIRLACLGLVVLVIVLESVAPTLAESSIIRTFVNGTATDLEEPEVRDLHIEYTHAISSAQVVGSSTAGPSITINQNQPNKVDVTFTRKLRPGESIGISVTSGSNSLGVKKWWWTKGGGAKASRKFRFTKGRRTLTATITDYGPEHRGDEPRLPVPKVDLHTIKNKSHHWGGNGRRNNAVKITMDIRPLVDTPPGGLDADKLRDNIKKAVKQWTDCTKKNIKSRVPKAGQNGNPKNHGNQFARDPAVMAPGPTHKGAKGVKFRSVTARECDAVLLKYPAGLDVNFIEAAGDTRRADVTTGWGVPATFGGALGAGPTEHDRSQKDTTTRGKVHMRPPSQRFKWHLAMNTDSDTNYITNGDMDVVPADAYDFYSVFKHEFGHVLCLHHSGVNFTEAGANQFGQPRPSGNGTESQNDDCCPHGHSQGDEDEEEGSTEEAPDSYFFSSSRPGGFGGFDIWTSERDGEGQWVPRNLGPEINSPADELDPFLAGDGTWLLFTSNRPGGQGGFDLFESIFDLENDQWREAAPLEGVNSPNDDRHATLPTDQRTLFFHSDRPGGFGGADVWSSELVEEIGFTEPTNLGDQVNSPFNDGDPSIAGDGLLLWFASDRPGGQGGLDIWLTRLTPDGWEQPGNVIEVNTPFNEVHPGVRSSNDMLLFSSDRPGGAGQLDVYQAPILSEPPQVIELYGTAQGGQLDILINANGARGANKAPCLNSVPTVAGQDAVTVAENVAAALGSDPCIEGQGVRVTLQANNVLVARPGMTPDDVAVSLLDPGLSLEPLQGPPGSLPPSQWIVLGRGSSAGNVTISWPPSCSSEAEDYGIYEGDLALLRTGGGYTHAFVDCLDDDGDLTEEIAPRFAASYFIVVPNDLNVEGGYGVDSNMAARPRGDLVCVPDQDAACPEVDRFSESRARR